MNLRNRRPFAHVIATIFILSLPRKERESHNLVHMKTKTLSLVLISLLGYFSASPISQAVTPPPDVAYPSGNAPEGDNALLGLTTGTYNTAVGRFSLQSNLTANFNTPIGAISPKKEQE
jgi:hypothetical protein